MVGKGKNILRRLGVGLSSACGLRGGPSLPQGEAELGTPTRSSHPHETDSCAACRLDAERYTERRIRLTHLESARAFSAAVEAKDPFTRAHALKVCNYAVELGLRLKLPTARLMALRTAALLHDIGKIGVPDAVLQKPGTLTPDESRLIRRHPLAAISILRHASFFVDELPIILHHHEWYDGSGYPAGLAGERIPLESRILCVADAIDAMLSPRAYKAGFDLAHVRRELTRYSGRQFDPGIVREALAWLAGHPERFAAQNS
jgi:HD-GYP domain-containing protein (c-di-GMP phosphodiesterase class II)